MFEVTIPSIDRWPPLLRMTQGVQHPEVRLVMGRAIANLIRRNFIKLDGERANKLGGERTHFYAAARRAVQNPRLQGSAGVTVEINHRGIAQRYYGGEILPQQRNWLTIAAQADAYGTRAREHAHLAFVYIRRGLAALIDKNGNQQRGQMDVWFWLVKRVYQPADPSVLPTEKELMDAALDAGEEHIGLLIQRAQV